MGPAGQPVRKAVRLQLRRCLPACFKIRLTLSGGHGGDADPQANRQLRYRLHNGVPARTAHLLQVVKRRTGRLEWCGSAGAGPACQSQHIRLGDPG
jgi:hypothetical protein